jgi:hypothetical protein
MSDAIDLASIGRTLREMEADMRPSAAKTRCFNASLLAKQAAMRC